jgi:hypothetical protein
MSLCVLCLQSPVRQVVPSYFSDRSPVISPRQSAAIVAGLQEIGMVDAEGWLLADPEQNKLAQTVSNAASGLARRHFTAAFACAASGCRTTRVS